jgi:hypothetical protein
MLRNRRLLVPALTLFATFGLGFIFLGGFDILAGSSRSVVFQPDTRRFANVLARGGNLEFETSLVNVSSIPLRVDQLPVSCGCMAVFDNQKTEFPHVFEPNGRLPLKVRISTENRTGFNKFVVVAKVSSLRGDVYPDSDFVVEGNLMTGLRADPAWIFLEVSTSAPEEPIRRTVRLADDWSGDGVGVKKIETTSDWIKTSLTEASTKIIHSGLDLKVRYNLEVTCSPPANKDSFDEEITITPKVEGLEPLVIPVKCIRKGPYSFSPDNLLFYSRHPGEKVERILSYQYTESMYANVKIVNLPTNVEVVEMPSSSTGVRCFKLASTMPDAVGRRAGEILIKVEHTGAMVKVPVSWVVSRE